MFTEGNAVQRRRPACDPLQGPPFTGRGGGCLAQAWRREGGVGNVTRRGEQLASKGREEKGVITTKDKTAMI